MRVGGGRAARDLGLPTLGDLLPARGRAGQLGPTGGVQGLEDQREVAVASMPGLIAPAALVRSNKRTLSFWALAASRFSSSVGAKVPARLSVSEWVSVSTIRRMNSEYALQGSPSSWARASSTAAMYCCRPSAASR